MDTEKSERERRRRLCRVGHGQAEARTVVASYSYVVGLRRVMVMLCPSSILDTNALALGSAQRPSTKPRHSNIITREDAARSPKQWRELSPSCPTMIMMTTMMVPILHHDDDDDADDPHRARCRPDVILLTFSVVFKKKRRANIVRSSSLRNSSQFNATQLN